MSNCINPLYYKRNLGSALFPDIEIELPFSEKRLSGKPSVGPLFGVPAIMPESPRKTLFLPNSCTVSSSAVKLLNKIVFLLKIYTPIAVM